MYDPVIGRWTTIDPYGEFWSPYVAFGNNPINFNDPSGGMTDGPIFRQGDCKCSYVDADGNRVSEYSGTAELWTLRYYSGFDFGGFWDELNAQSEAAKKELLDPLYAKDFDDFMQQINDLIPLGQGSIRTGLQDEVSPSNEQLAAGIAPIFLTRRSAFRAAKRANNIPMSAEPIKKFTVIDKHTGKSLEVHRFKNNDGKLIDIRRDNPFRYPDGGYQGPHFNAGPSGGKLNQHFYYVE